MRQVGQHQLACPTTAASFLLELTSMEASIPFSTTNIDIASQPSGLRSDEVPGRRRRRW